jgi:hypothetical protein
MRASCDFAARVPGPAYGNIDPALPAWRPANPDGRDEYDLLFEMADRLYRESQPNPDIPAGYAFLGQFVTHDITFDTRLDPRSAHLPRSNRRTPALDLDSLYGGGPVAQPYLYELADPRHFWIPRNVFGEWDLPRNDDTSVAHPSSGGPFSRRRTALIADPRNDENTLLSQLHLAFLRFHNARVDAGLDFERAREETTWHYQWVVVHDFLRRVCGDQILERILLGKQTLLKGFPLLPNEFALAAMRFGHSMVGSAYHLNSELQHLLCDEPIPLFQSFGVEWRHRDRAATNSLEGERALPASWTVQWDRFVETGNENAQRSRRIDPLVSPPLRRLPILPALGRDERIRSLAYLTLKRGFDQELPSGQALAQRLGVSVAPELNGDDPIWLYILNEADFHHQGRRLGPLGATLIGEVVIGLLRNDARSFLNQKDWKPTLRRRDPARFDLADFLTAARVPITARHWRSRLGP